MDNWSDYHLALAVYEAGSHAAAGRVMGLSQPTVSRRMRALETHLGGALFERRGDVLTPTALGRSVIDHARNMQDEAAAIERAARTGHERIEGRVTVAASDGIGADWLPGALTPLLEAHPDLSVELKIGFEPANLAGGEADIAVRWGQPGPQHSLLARRAAEVGSGMYASECYLKKHGAPQTLDDVADHVAVGWANTIAFQWPRTPIGDELRPRRDVMVAAHPSAHLEGLRNGLGLGVTSHRLARARPGLVRILPDFEVMLDLWLVAHGAVRRSRAQATVLDHIAEALRADRDHFRNGEPSRFGQTDSRPC